MGLALKSSFRIFVKNGEGILPVFILSIGLTVLQAICSEFARTL
jgi:hypothetical protein